MVELDLGCNHMTFITSPSSPFPLSCPFLPLIGLILTTKHDSCRCGTQFCYNYRAPWKNYSCEQWDEHRLLARAYQLIDREEEQPLAANPPPDINKPQLEDHLATETDKSHLKSQETQPEQSDKESHATPEASASPYFQTPQDILVARTIQELRENHKCVHDR